jgi:ATP-binding cassette subfamily F protein 3
MSREAPQLLLLDEPTNHLDVDARQALIQALNDYPGAVVLVSHDPHLIELIAERLWLVADGTVAPYDGDLEDYRGLLAEQRRAERRADKPDKAGSANGRASRKDKRRAAAEARASVAHLRKAAKQAEARLETLTRRKQAIEARLAAPEVYDGPTAALQDLQLEHGALKQAIAEAEDAWLNAQAALEEA